MGGHGSPLRRGLPLRTPAHLQQPSLSQMPDVRFRVRAASYWTVRPPSPLKPLVKLVLLSTLIRISIHDRADDTVHLLNGLRPAGGAVVSGKN